METSFQKLKKNKSCNSNEKKNMNKTEMHEYLKGELIKVEALINELNLKKIKLLDLIRECEESLET